MSVVLNQNDTTFAALRLNGRNVRWKAEVANYEGGGDTGIQPVLEALTVDRKVFFYAIEARLQPGSNRWFDDGRTMKGGQECVAATVTSQGGEDLEQSALSIKSERQVNPSTNISELALSLALQIGKRKYRVSWQGDRSAFYW